MRRDPTGYFRALTLQGQAAALALARRLGQSVDTATVLSNRGNLVVLLTPAPIVARIATLSAWSRSDPMAWLAREVAVARHVAARDGPMVPPALAVDPGPHCQDGLVISLWEYVPPQDRRPRPADVGVALARLHEAARDCPADLGDMSPVRELISDGLAVLEQQTDLDAGTLAALRSVHADVLAGLPANLAKPTESAESAKPTEQARPAEPTKASRPGQSSECIVLHGDAHAGNLIADARRGWIWLDLEETCRGPAAWDLATVASHYDANSGQTALRAYAAEARIALPDAAELARMRRARLLEGAVWSLCMAQLYPARYADVASRLVTDVLGR